MQISQIGFKLPSKIVSFPFKEVRKLGGWWCKGQCFSLSFTWDLIITHPNTRCKQDHVNYAGLTTSINNIYTLNNFKRPQSF